MARPWPPAPMTITSYEDLSSGLQRKCGSSGCSLASAYFRRAKGIGLIGLRRPVAARRERHNVIPRVQENFRSFKCSKRHHHAEVLGLTLEGGVKSGSLRLDNLRQPV